MAEQYCEKCGELVFGDDTCDSQSCTTDRLIDAAVAAEREACAKVVEGHLVGPVAGGPYEPHRYCCDMAEAIRARGGKAGA